MTNWTWRTIGRTVIGRAPAWTNSTTLFWGVDPSGATPTEFPWPGTGYPALHVRHIRFTLTTGNTAGGRRPEITARHGAGSTVITAAQGTGISLVREYEFGEWVDLDTTGITPPAGNLRAREALPANLILLPSKFDPEAPYDSGLTVTILNALSHSVSIITVVGDLIDQN